MNSAVNSFTTGMVQQKRDCAECAVVSLYKVKLKLSLYLIKYHAMKTYAGMEVKLHHF